jgi:hypothetical protein
MKIKINVGHVGIITLFDGTTFNYRVKRFVLKSNTLVFCTQKGINTFIENTTKVEVNSNCDRAKTESALIKLGYLGKINIQDVKVYT